MKLVDKFKVKKGKWYILYTSMSNYDIQWFVMLQPTEDVIKYGTYHAINALSCYWNGYAMKEDVEAPRWDSYEVHDKSLFFELSDEEYLKHIVAEQI